MTGSNMPCTLEASPHAQSSRHRSRFGEQDPVEQTKEQNRTSSFQSPQINGAGAPRRRYHVEPFALPPALTRWHPLSTPFPEPHPRQLEFPRSCSSGGTNPRRNKPAEERLAASTGPSGASSCRSWRPSGSWPVSAPAARAWGLGSGQRRTTVPVPWRVRQRDVRTRT